MERQEASKKEKQKKKKRQEKQRKEERRGRKEGEGGSRAAPGGPLPGPLGAAAGTRGARVCTPSAHPFFLVAAPPCQSPGRREGQPACVMTAGPAPAQRGLFISAGPCCPRFCRNCPVSPPHPAPCRGAEQTCCLERGPPGAQRRAGHVHSGLTAIPSLGSSVPVLRLPGTPHQLPIILLPSQTKRGLRQEACTPGGHCPSGILESPRCLARWSSSLRGTKRPGIRPFPGGGGQ